MIYHGNASTGWMLWLKYALLKGRPLRKISEIYSEYLLYKDYFSEIRDQFSIHIINLHRPNLPVRDNRLFVIRRV